MDDEFARYLDMYSPGDAALRAALDGRLAPASHVERYINVSFPQPYTGLNGLGDVGQPLGRPRGELDGSTGAIAPSPVWLQRALNTLLPEGSRLVVDGLAGPQTLRAAYDLWTRWAATPGAVTGRAAAVREAPASRPYAPRLVQVGPVSSVVLERAFLNFLIGRIQVADPPGSRCPEGAELPSQCPAAPWTQGNAQVDTPPPPEPPASSGTLIAALVAAALLGLWAARG